MPKVENLTKQVVENIQIDEGLVFVDYGETTEMKVAPTRGGGEFVANATIRNIEFDGRRGATAGTQLIDEQDATLNVTSICASQETLALAFPGATVESDGSVIKNPRCGLIPETAYRKNITMFARLLNGKYKKITIYNPMSEGGLTVRAVPKGEGEYALSLKAHYKTDNLNGDLWKIENIDDFSVGGATQTTQTTT